MNQKCLFDTDIANIRETESVSHFVSTNDVIGLKEYLAGKGVREINEECLYAGFSTTSHREGKAKVIGSILEQMLDEKKRNRVKSRLASMNPHTSL